MSSDLTASAGGGVTTAANGGTGQTTYAKGDLLAAPGGATLNKLAVGSDAQVLTADAASTNGVKWAAAASGGITNAAGANVIPKSNGANLIASGLSDDGTTISTAEKISTAVTTGLVGVGMAPVAMLDVTGPAVSSTPVVQATGTKPSAQATAAGTNAQTVLNIVGIAGGDSAGIAANRTAGTGSSISLLLGDGGVQTGASSGTARGGKGGDFALTMGNGGAATAVTGTVKGGPGSSFTWAGGAGGASATSTGGAGWSLLAQQGTGGVTTAAATSGKGGSYNWTAGTGGANSNAAGIAGDGGDYALDAGPAGVNSGGAAAGSNGTVSIGSTNAKTITVGNSSASLSFSGGVKFSVAAKTANYTLTPADNIITVDATAGNVTLTLPAASASVGQTYRIKRIDGSVNTITVARAGADTIDGATSTTLVTQYSSKDIVCLTASTWGIF